MHAVEKKKRKGVMLANGNAFPPPVLPFFDEQASVAAGNQPSVGKKQTLLKVSPILTVKTPIAMLPDPWNPWPNVREPGNLSKLVLEHSRVINLHASGPGMKGSVQSRRSTTYRNREHGHRSGRL